MSWILTAGALTAAAVLLARVRRAGILAAQAAHELRGPLTAAGLAVEGLRRDGSLSADRAAALEAQLRRAGLAVEDLAAAPSGARAPDRPEPVPAAAFVEQLALAWEPVAAARGVPLLVEPVRAGAGTLLIDPTRLAQAAGNLLANALEHGAGPVELRALAAGGRLRLEVRDGGPGLPGPVSALARRPRGARGRGLAIATGIAERHGGRLVAAPSPRGAALVLELPLLRGGAAVHAAQEGR